MHIHIQKRLLKHLNDYTVCTILIFSICIIYSFSCSSSESAELSDSESNARKLHFHDNYATKNHSKTQITQIDDLFAAMSEHRYQDALRIIDNIEKVQPIFRG